jgi:hypothetical protein
VHTNLLIVVDLKHRQLVYQAAFARLDVITRLRMASHSISRVLRAHVHFESLDFIVSVEEELVRVLAP